MRRVSILCLLCVLFAPGTLWGQGAGNGRIMGVVTDASSAQPLAGVSVTLVGTQRGTVSGADGRFVLTGVPTGAQTVRANLIGYAPQTLAVNVAADEAAIANFQLASQAVVLEGIVAVGYGQQERRTVTGAVASVSAERLLEVPTSNPIQALQGRVPGVEITASDNLPGSGMNIRIRGVRSITASNEPLYVVDGIPLSGGIGDFDPASIQSIDILKDASATAVYGSRGANGVVLITTKTGAAAGAMATRFTLDAYSGASRPRQLIEMMSMEQYTQMLVDAARYAGVANPTPQTVLTNNAMRAAYEAGLQTDWQREIMRTGQQNSFQLGMLGSTDNTRFSLSGNFFDQSGLTEGQNFRRGVGTASVDHTMNRLRLGVTASVTRSLQEVGAGDGIWGTAIAQTGFGRPFDDNGALILRPDGESVVVNPLWTQQQFIRELTRNRVFASAFADLRIAEGVNFRVNFGPDYTSADDGQYKGPESIYDGGFHSDRRAQLQSTQTFAWTLDNILQINRDFGRNHRIDATLLYGMQAERWQQTFGSAQQIPYESALWYRLDAGSSQVTRSELREWALESYMARVNYTLLDRYTISGAVRRDGSSRLADGNKWSVFPSVGVAWLVGDEAFMQNVDFVSAMKLRASYGIAGNTAINPYQTQGALQRTLYNFGADNGFGYGPNPGNPANPFLGWEKTYKSNVGLDLGVLGNRITGTLDVYREDTRDLLLTRQLPATSGYTATLENIGDVRNQGVEIGLSTVNLDGRSGGLRWTSDISWATNDNKITSLPTGREDGCPVGVSRCDLVNGWFVGHPINVGGQAGGQNGPTTPAGGTNADNQRRVWFDYRFNGIWQLGQEAEAKTYGDEFRPGQIRLMDVNGDGRITAADRTILGNTYAKWTGSLYNRFEWRGVDLSALATARWGYMIADQFGMGTNALSGRMGNIVTDYWTPENPSNTQPAPNNNGNAVAFGNTRGYRDGSHWRIRNVTLGYAVPAGLAGRVGAGTARIYATAQDPIVFTDYKGYDPENGTAGGAPAYRTLLIGAQVHW